MPEGPEVRRTTDDLADVFSGKRIRSLKFTSGRYSRKSFSGYAGFSEGLPKHVENVSCKGKFIYFRFLGGDSLWNTLGMSGYWSLKPGKHCRAILETTEGQTMFYNDMRNFGTFKYVKSPIDLTKKLSSIGPDLLSEDVSLEQFEHALLKGKRPDKQICQLLMDQSVVSGIGNYLKAEILYNTRISPHRVCRDITRDELHGLLRVSKKIMNLSYELGGATIQNYKNASGKNGMYTRRFAVYNQETGPLGHVVVREKTADNRTTHWVPDLQY